MSISGSLTGNTFTSQQGSQDFLQLLVTQLRYQDPLEPVKQEDFIQQLTQLSTLEGVENLNARFGDMLQLQQLTDGANLVGKTVTFEEGADAQQRVGRVDSVSVENQKLMVVVSGNAVPIDRVTGLAAEANIV